MQHGSQHLRYEWYRGIIGVPTKHHRVLLLHCDDVVWNLPSRGGRQTTFRDVHQMAPSGLLGYHNHLRSHRLHLV